MSRALAIWLTLLLAALGPIAIAASSPLLAWRDPVYIAAGFAGVVALSLILVQPLLAAGVLPGLSVSLARKAHLWGGIVLVLAVLCHVGGLWITSPPDVIDALLFVSATPFSVWGVGAMWAVFAAAALGFVRKRLRWRPALWRALHIVLVTVVAIGTVIHALLIEGTMGMLSKLVLCGLVIICLGGVVIKRRPWRGLKTASNR